MKTLLSAALLATTLVIPTTADAARLGYYPQMDVVAQTHIPTLGLTAQGGLATYTLCHMTVARTFGIPIYYESDGYGLSANNCEGTRYTPLSTEEFAELQAAGMIAADIAQEPAFNAAQKRTHLFSTLLGSILGLMVAIAVISRKLRLRRRRAMIGTKNTYTRSMLDVMCHIAKIDGQVDVSEISAIARIAHALTGRRFTPEQIAEIVNNAESKLAEADYKRFAKGLAEGQKDGVMQAAILVAAADSFMDDREKQFIGNLGRALKMDVRRVGDLYRDILGVGGAQPA